MVSYQYRVRTDRRPTTVKDFTMVVRIHSPDPLGPIYSPSHDVAIDRRGDREAVVSFERNACRLDKDFQLYFPQGRADRLFASDPAPLARRSGLLPALAQPQPHPTTRTCRVILSSFWIPRGAWTTKSCNKPRQP